jgi:hypothetical protein
MIRNHSHKAVFMDEMLHTTLPEEQRTCSEGSFKLSSAPASEEPQRPRAGGQIAKVLAYQYRSAIAAPATFPRRAQRE